jgi:hypothetical protein
MTIVNAVLIGLVLALVVTAILLVLAIREMRKPRRRSINRDLQEALETLYDFREFWSDNVTQTKLGAGHHNPMWGRVAEVLDKHGMNSGPGGARAYYKFDPAYRNNN